MGSPPRDVVLVLRAFVADADQLRPRLDLLGAELGRSIQGVDAYLRRGADLALFVCRLDGDRAAMMDLRGLSGRLRSMGGELIDLATTGAEHEARLREKVLPRCEVSCREVRDVPAAVDALLAAVGREPPAGAVRREPPPRLRFRRGDAWQVGRLGRMTEDRLYVITGAPLRVGERTILEIAAPSVAAQFPVVVTEEAQACAPGTWGFTVRVTADGPRRPSDQNVLTWAKNRVALARTLPARTEHRIPLSWPARLRDQTREHPIVVRDVSNGGVFAEMARAPEGSLVSIRLPYDLGATPLELDGEVARVVDQGLAMHHGVPLGVGIRVRPLTRDSARYAEFVGRVAQRAERHVLIGARAARLAQLVQHFASVGYLTTGCEDIKSLCARAGDGIRPPEVVLVDKSLATAEQVRPRIPRRGLPVLDIQGPPIDARRLVDAALL